MAVKHLRDGDRVRRIFGVKCAPMERVSSWVSADEASLVVIESGSVNVRYTYAIVAVLSCMTSRTQQARMIVKCRECRRVQF